MIAYGSTEARLPAICLLFHYWPELYPPAFQGFETLKPKHYTWERECCLKYFGVSLLKLIIKVPLFTSSLEASYL